MDINNVLSRFQKVKPLKKGSWQVRCPCHDDSKASLTITDAGDKILMHCHAGCNVRDIVQAVGLTMADLGSKKKEKSWQEKLGAEAIYNYGSYIKIRQPGKKIWYGKVVGGQLTACMPAEAEKTLYRLPELLEAIKEGYPVYYVEGEKDADNLRKLGFTACTAGGTGDWNKRFAPYFKGAKLVILPDNDKPGLELAGRIQRDVKGYAFSVKTVITGTESKEDVSDFLAKGNTKQDLLEKVKAAQEVYAPWVRTNGGILTDVLAHTITKTMDYMVVKKPGLDVAEFYVYRDGVYRKCSKGEAKALIKEYLPLGYATDNCLNNVYNLLLCTTEKSVNFADVDREERYINVKNGIIDLTARKLVKHSPELLQTIQLNCNYNPEADCPRWLEYMDTLCSNQEGVVDKEKRELIQEWMGLLLSNVNVARTKKCLVLVSLLGNTGKSVFLRVLGDFFGIDYIANIPIQNMADRFALGDLCGKRLDIVGDQKSEDIADSSVFKQLTGGDAVKIEFKGKQSFSWQFTGGIVMACNALPAFTDDKGGHVFERLSIIPCERVIPQEERDGGLSQKLWREADGILNWALEGLYRLRDNSFKFTSCASGEEALEEYRGRLDTLYGYIAENYTITGNAADRVPKKGFEDAYLDWCKESGLMPLNKRNIKERAAKSGIMLVKVQGNYYYKGLQVKNFAEVDPAEVEVWQEQIHL